MRAHKQEELVFSNWEAGLRFPSSCRWSEEKQFLILWTSSTVFTPRLPLQFDFQKPAAYSKLSSLSQAHPSIQG